LEEQTDKQLMAEFLQGKKEAFVALFQRYKQKVLNFALRLLGNRADAEDVTSDVFVTVLKKKYRIDPNAKFATWLFTITRNFCISKIRKRNRTVSMWFQSKETEEDAEWEIPDENPLPDEEARKREEIKMVKKGIQNLPLPQKEALILREYHNFSYEEIAKIMNCSLEQVKILIYRGRERLRTELSPLLREGNDG